MRAALGGKGKATCTAGAATRFPARSRGVGSGGLGGRSCSGRSTACCWREVEEVAGSYSVGWGNGDEVRLDGGGEHDCGRRGGVYTALTGADEAVG
jgi:hypothetical protein